MARPQNRSPPRLIAPNLFTIFVSHKHLSSRDTELLFLISLWFLIYEKCQSSHFVDKKSWTKSLCKSFVSVSVWFQSQWCQEILQNLCWLFCKECSTVVAELYSNIFYQNFFTVIWQFLTSFSFIQIWLLEAQCLLGAMLVGHKNRKQIWCY